MQGRGHYRDKNNKDVFIFSTNKCCLTSDTVCVSVCVCFRRAVSSLRNTHKVLYLITFFKYFYFNLMLNFSVGHNALFKW